MGNSYLERLEKQGAQSHGKTSEKRVAKKLGARLQPNSGAVSGAKGDMRLERRSFRFRTEAKSTVKDTIPLDLGWLSKIGHEARSAGEIPMVTVSFVTPEGKPRTEINPEWVCIPMWALQTLLD